MYIELRVGYLTFKSVKGNRKIMDCRFEYSKYSIKCVKVKTKIRLVNYYSKYFIRLISLFYKSSCIGKKNSDAIVKIYLTNKYSVR